MSFMMLGAHTASPAALRLPKRVAAILRKFGNDAHVYMPGPGVPILGPNLVTNGDFSNGLTGWNANGVGAVVGGELQITAPGNTPYPGCNTLVTTIPGRVYSVSISGRRGTSSSAAALAISRSGGFGNLLGQAFNFGTAQTTFSTTITSDWAVWDVLPHISGTPAAAGTCLFDNIEIREILGYISRINGFEAANFLESTGNTYAALDGAVGLVLDAAGSVGAELVVAASSWGLLGDGGTNIVVNTGTSSVTFNGSEASFSGFSFTGSVSVGKTYKATFTISSRVAGQVQLQCGGFSSPFVNANGSYSYIFTASGTLGATIKTDSNIFNGVVSGLSIREITGTHATQTTTANKPTLRRGIVNLGKYSRPNSGQWQTGISGTGVAPVVTHNYAAAPDGSMTATRVQLNKGAGTTSADFSQFFSFHDAPITGRYTTALWVRTTDGQPKTVTYRDGNSFGPVALDGNWKLITEVRDYTGQTPGMGVRMRGGETADSTADLLVWDGGFFQGTLTAAQIIAAGGIPFTTTSPASSLYGVETTFGPETIRGTWSQLAEITASGSGQAATLAFNNAPAGAATNNSGGGLGFTPNKSYQVTYTVSGYTGGAVYFQSSSGGYTGQTRSANGTYTEIITPTGTAAQWVMKAASAGTTCVVSNISVKEILGYKSLPNSYAWQFDGVDDRLECGVPFQASDDFLILAVARTDTAASYPFVFCLTDGVGSTSHVGLLFSQGKPGFELRGAGGFAGLSSGAPVVQRACVVSGKKTGNNLVLKVDGAQVGTSATTAAGVVATFAKASIGARLYSAVDLPLNGQVFSVIAIKGTVSEAEEKAMVKLLGSIAGVSVA